jgi:hypothetical protein
MSTNAKGLFRADHVGSLAAAGQIFFVAHMIFFRPSFARRSGVRESGKLFDWDQVRGRLFGNMQLGEKH